MRSRRPPAGVTRGGVFPAPRPGRAAIPTPWKPPRRQRAGGGYLTDPGVFDEPWRPEYGVGPGGIPFLPPGGFVPIPGTPGQDLAAGVAGDWEYGAALEEIEAANRAEEAAAGEQINALAVNWGGDLSDLVRQGLISQAAADAGKVNQFSQMAEFGRELQQGLGRGASQAAARGILTSGALPALTAELNRGYQEATHRGLQNLMGQVREIRGGAASRAAQRRQSLAGVRSSVAQRLSQLEAYQPIPNMRAIWNPEIGAYEDAWGRRFDGNGNRLS